jgi:hypothetical protein
VLDGDREDYDIPRILDDKPRLGGRCQGSTTAKRRAQRGLDSGRASATLLLSGECQLGSGLHAHTKSLTDLVRRGRAAARWLVTTGACWIAGAWDTSRLSS